MPKSRRSWRAVVFPGRPEDFVGVTSWVSSVQGQDGPDRFPTDVELSGYSSWSHAPSTHSDNLPPFPQADWCRHLVTSIKLWFYCILRAPMRFTRTYRMGRITSEWDLLYIGPDPVCLVLTKRVNFTLLARRNVHLTAHTIWNARVVNFPWRSEKYSRQLGVTTILTKCVWQWRKGMEEWLHVSYFYCCCCCYYYYIVIVIIIIIIIIIVIVTQ